MKPDEDEIHSKICHQYRNKSNNTEDGKESVAVETFQWLSMQSQRVNEHSDKCNRLNFWIFDNVLYIWLYCDFCVATAEKRKNWCYEGKKCIIQLFDILLFVFSLQMQVNIEEIFLIKAFPNFGLILSFIIIYQSVK